MNSSMPRGREEQVPVGAPVLLGRLDADRVEALLDRAGRLVGGQDPLVVRDDRAGGVVELLPGHQRSPSSRSCSSASRTDGRPRSAAPCPTASASRSTRSRRRPRPRARPGAATPLGDAGRGDEDVVARDEVVVRQDAVEVVARSSTSARRSSSLRGHSWPWSAPPRHLIAAAEMTPSGVPPIAHQHVDTGRRPCGRDRRARRRRRGSG